MKIYYFLLAMLLLCVGVQAQIAETDPNDSQTDAGVQYIYEPTTITGSVTSGDVDVWFISREATGEFLSAQTISFNQAVVDDRLVVTAQRTNGSWQGSSAGSFNMNDPAFASDNAFQVSWDNGTADWWGVLFISTTDAGSVDYSIPIQNAGNFEACSYPTATSNLNFTPTGENSLQLNSYDAATVADGYIVKINSTNSFTDVPQAQYGLDDLASANTVYSGSGEQIVYVGSSTSPSVEVTGLSANTTYYYKVYPYSYCKGFLLVNQTSTPESWSTCGTNAAPSAVTSISTSVSSSSTLQVNSYSGDVGANTYVVKINTTNTFTPISNGSSLPSASATYIGGEQVIYAGSSASPSLNVSNLDPNTTYYIKVFAAADCSSTYYFESTGYATSATTCKSAPSASSTGLILDQVGVTSARLTTIGDNQGSTGYVVYMNSTNDFTPPSDGSLPSATTAFAGTGQQAVYVGGAGAVNTTITGLSSSNTYFLKAYGYNQCASTNYFETTGKEASFSTCTPDATLASNGQTREVGDTFIDFYGFSAEAASGYIVKINTSNSFTGYADGSTSLPTANTTYGGSGEQVVYVGSSTIPNIRVTGLSASTEYYFAVYSYEECNGERAFQPTPYVFSQINSKPTPTITFNDQSVTYSTNPGWTYLNASSNSSGSISYSLVSQTGGGTILENGNRVTPGDAGTVVFQVDQAADNTYNPGSAQMTFTINKADPYVQFNSFTLAYGSGDASLSSYTYTTSTGTISYSIVGDANGNVLSGTDNATITAGDAGTTTTLRATVAEAANYLSATKDATVTITALREIFVMGVSDLLRMSGGVVDSVYDLSGQGSADVTNGLVLFNGSLYGFSGNGPGGSEYGRIYEMAIDGTLIQDFYTSTSSTRQLYNNGNLISDGTLLWGSTVDPTPGNSTLFSIDAAGNYTERYVFDRSSEAYDIRVTATTGSKVYGYAASSSGDRSVLWVYDVVGDAVTIIAPSGYVGYGAAIPVDGNIVFAAYNTTTAESWYSISEDGTGGVTAIFSYNSSWAPTVFVENVPVTVEGNTIYYSSNQGVYSFDGSTAANPSTIFSGLSATGLAIDGSNLIVTIKYTSDGTNFNYLVYEMPKTGGSAEYLGGVAGTMSSYFEGNPVVYKEFLTPELNFSDQSYVYDASAITLEATTNSSGAITYEIITDNTGGAALANGNELTPGGIGTVVVRANLAGDDNFNSATVDVTLTFTQGTPSITLADITAAYRDADIDLSALTTTNSDGAVSYSLVSNNTSSAINTNTLTVGIPGTDVLKVSMAATANFAAGELDINLTINEATATLSFTDIDKVLDDPDFDLSATNDANVAINYSYVSNHTGSIIDGNTVVLGTIAGVDQIKATVVEPYYVQDEATINLTLNKLDPVLSWSPANIEYYGYFNVASLNASADVDGTFEYLRLCDYDCSSDPFHPACSTGSQNGYYCTLDETYQETAEVGSTVTYQVVFTPTNAARYNEASYEASITIDPIDLTIVAEDKEIFLGDPDETLTYTITEGYIAAPHNFYLPLTRDAGTTAGTYSIYPDPSDVLVGGRRGDTPYCPDGGVQIYNESGGYVYCYTTSHYNLTFINGTYTITDKYDVTITLSSADLSATYDGTQHAVGIASITDDRDGSSVSPTVNITYTGINGTVYLESSTAPTQAGEYTVTATVDDADPDFRGTVTETLIISPVALTITADSKTITYGNDANSSNTVTYSGFITGESEVDLSGSLTFANITDINVGTYTGAIIPSGYTSANYTITYENGDLTIDPVALTVTTDAQSKTYGDADQEFTYQVTTGALQYSDAFSGDLARDAGEDVGTYAINQGTLDAGSNYTLTFVSDDLTINARALEVTADAVSKTYGDTDPVLTYQLTTGDLQFTDTFSGELARAAGEDVGSYTIDEGTLDAGSNYNVAFVSNDLTIGSRALEVTADAKSKTYGDTDPAFTYTLTSGVLQFTDAISGDLTRVAGEGVGTYAINQGTLDAGSNYNLTYVPANLTIGAYPLTVTADAKSKTYGDSDPALTYQITNGSLQFTDALSGSLTRVAGENVGTYAINEGSLDAGSNYDLTYVPGSLTIGAYPLTVTADAKSKTYGDSDPELTYQITSGLLQFTDALSGSLTRVAGENVGTYAINQSTLEAGSNYNLTYVSNDLTIGAYLLTVTADSKSKTYGDSDPALTYQITSGSLQFTDALSGSLTRISGEDVGTYTINQGTLDAGSNYDLIYVSDDLTIGSYALTITTDAQSKTYGDSDPVLTYSLTSGALQFSDALSGSLNRTVGEDVGTYAINVGSLSAGSNYSITLVSDDLTIAPKTLIVNADDQTRSYGETNPGLTLSYSGFVSGDDVSVLDTAPTASTTADATSAIGNYDIVPSGGVDNNYTFSYVNGTLTVTKANQSISFSSLASKTYGDADFDLSATATSGLTVEFASSNTSVATVSGVTVTIVGVGSTTITASQSGDGNYNAASAVQQTLTITQATQTITFGTIADVDISEGTLTLNATSSSGLTVSYEIVSGPANVTGSIVTLTGTGTVEVRASQAGNANYLAATEVIQSFNVTDASKQDQTITFDAIADKAYGDVFTLTASASSGLDIAYTVESGPATLNGLDLIVTGLGSVTVRAAQTGDDTFNPAQSVTQTFAAGKAALTVKADDQSINEGDTFPIFTISYSGFVNDEDVSVLTSESSASVTITDSNTAGTYAITASGGEAMNYTFKYVEGTLTINQALGLGQQEDIRVYPNPATEYISIQTSSAKRVDIFDLKGSRVLSSDKVDEEMDVSGLGRGVYLIRLYDAGGEVIHTERIIKN